MSRAILNRALLTGLDNSAMQHIGNQQWLHQEAMAAFLQLKAALANEGFDLAVVSAWRSFERQARIWQAKCLGQRPVFNHAQQRVDVTSLSAQARIEAIMLYSALPGASRHHWGTEIDVYDAAAVPIDYQVQLNTDEYQGDGPFATLAQWLQQNAADYGFFLPYRAFRGGVAAEPWHLSYQPLASACQAALTLEQLQQTLMDNPIAEQATVLQMLPELYPRFITNICEAEI
ncbi:M15 family metallopeptidase [Alishewanella sp. HL-SH06]|uniref:M15 family metallopeptidase n=1 Tax=Alishewanella sp. HL-SH06 TaxID=3461144 RepID=UPI0040425FA1